MLYMTSVSPASEYWFSAMLIQELPGSVCSLSPEQAGAPLVSPEPSTGQHELLWTHEGSTSAEEAEEWFCQGSSQKEVICSNPELFNTKSLRKMFRKRSAVEIQFGSQKGNQWGWKPNTSKSLAWTKLRGMADKQQSIIHRDLAELEQEPHEGTEQGRGLHTGRIMCSAQALTWAALHVGEGSK